MNNIPQETAFCNPISECCKKFAKRFKVNALLRRAGAAKEKGVPAYEIFTFLMGLVFTGKNLHTLIATAADMLSFGKDAVYRFLKKASVNWNKFVFGLSCAVVSDIDRLTSESRRTAIIIDDTPYYRDRSKKVELLSRFKDSSNNCYYKGFNLLNFGWADGETFLPLDYRVLANGEDQKLVCGSDAAEDNRTLATRRRRDARRPKPDLVLEVLKTIKGTPAEAKYVIFDSWYSSPKAIMSINALEYKVVARLKDNENYRYVFQGKILSLSSIYARCKKRRGKSRYLLSVEVEVQHKDSENTVPARIVYVRDRGKPNEWIAILTTDMSLNEEEIIALYGKRWCIEPFHKVIKSVLNLETEFQMRSFDAIVAHTAIVMARYLLLAHTNRENKDWRSINDGFYRLCTELEDISFSNAFKIIMAAIKTCFFEYLRLTNEALEDAVRVFMFYLPDSIMGRIKFSLCES